MLLGAARIATAFDWAGLAASGAEGVSKSIDWGKKAAAGFATGFKDENGRQGDLSKALQRSFENIERLSAAAGKKTAESFTGGINAIMSGNPGASFDVATQSLTSFIETTGQAGQVVTEFGSMMGPIKPLFEAAGVGIGIATTAMAQFTETGGAYLSTIAEIGDAYLTLRRTLAGSTLDMEQVNAQMVATQEIMASGAVDHFDDVAQSIGRFSRSLGLSGTDLREFTETYASMAELIGTVSPTNVAGVLNAFAPSDGSMTQANGELYDYNEQLTRFTNIIRATGGNAQSMVDSMIRVGPAMRALGFDSGGTALFFGGLLEKGLRGQKLVYGMNQIVEQMHDQVASGAFDDLEQAFEGLLNTVQRLQAAGRGDQAIALLSQYTTPANATLLNEAISKGIIGNAEEMGKRAGQGFGQNLSEQAAETADLGDIFENIQQTATAAVAPVGLAFNSFIVEGGSKLVDWLSENQVMVAEWANNIAGFFLEGFQALIGGIGDFFQAFSVWVNPVVEVVVTSIQVIWNTFRLFFDGLGKLGSIIPDWLGGDKLDIFRSMADGMGSVNEGMDRLRNMDLSQPILAFGNALDGVAGKIPSVLSAMDSAVTTYGENLEVRAAFTVVPETNEDGSPVLNSSGQQKMTQAFGPIDGYQRDAEGNALKDEQGNPLKTTALAPMLQLTGDAPVWEKVKQNLKSLGIEITLDATKGIITNVEATSDSARKMWEQWFNTATKTTTDVYSQAVDPKTGKPLDPDSFAENLSGGTAKIEVDGQYIQDYVASLGLTVPGIPVVPGGTPATSSGAGAGSPAPTSGGYTAPSGPGNAAAPASGNQPGTAMAQQVIAKTFPQIKTIGGQRDDPLPYHNEGRALDVMIPEWNTAAGKALGDSILTYVQTNAAALGVEDVIWQNTWRKGGDLGPGDWMEQNANAGPTAAHYDHLHISFNPGSQVDLSKLVLPPGVTVSAPPAGAPAATFGAPLAPAPAPAAPAPAGPIASGAPTGGPGTSGVMMDGQQKKYWTVEANGAVVWRGQSGNPTKPPEGQPGQAATTPPPSTWPPTANAAAGAGAAPAAPALGVTEGTNLLGIKTSADLDAFAKTAAYAALNATERKALVDQVIKNAGLDSAAKAAKTQQDAANTNKDAAEKNAKAAEATARAAADAKAAQEAAARPFGPGINERNAANESMPGKVAAGMDWAKKTYGGKDIPGYIENGELVGSGFRPTPSKSQTANPPAGVFPTPGVRDGYTEILGVPVKNRDVVQDVKDLASGAGQVAANFGKEVLDNLVGKKGSPGEVIGRIGGGVADLWNFMTTPQSNVGAYATGGPVFGPGTGTSDEIPAWLSNGEFVQTAAAVNHYGVDFMHALNARKLPKLKAGGQIDTSGAQVNTIGLADAVSKRFSLDDVHLYRGPDGYNEHSSGQAADFMVAPLHQAAIGEQLRTGNNINLAALALADQFGVKYTIWQNKMWYPNGSTSDYGANPNDATQAHMDHVHARTVGGGYPAGGGPGKLGVGDRIPSGMSQIPAKEAAANRFIELGYSDGGSVDEQGRVYLQPKTPIPPELWGALLGKDLKAIPPFNEGGEVDQDGRVFLQPKDIIPPELWGVLLGAGEDAIPPFSEGGIADISTMPGFKDLQRRMLKDAFAGRGPSADKVAAADMAEWISLQGVVGSDLFRNSNAMPRYATGGFAAHKADGDMGGSGNNFGYTDWGNNWEKYWEWVKKTDAPHGRTPKFAPGGEVFPADKVDADMGGSGDQFGYTDWGKNWEKYWRWVKKTGAPHGRNPKFAEGGEVTGQEKLQKQLLLAAFQGKGGEGAGGQEGGLKEKVSKVVANALSGSFWLNKLGVDTSTEKWNQKGLYVPMVTEALGLVSRVAGGDGNGMLSAKDAVDFFALPDAVAEAKNIGSSESTVGSKGVSVLAMAGMVPGLGKVFGKAGDAARGADVAGPGIIQLPVDLMEHYAKAGELDGSMARLMAKEGANDAAEVSGRAAAIERVGIRTPISMISTPMTGHVVGGIKDLRAAALAGRTTVPVKIEEFAPSASLIEGLSKSPALHLPETPKTIYDARQLASHEELLRRNAELPPLPSGTEFRFFKEQFSLYDNWLFAWLGKGGKADPRVAIYDDAVKRGLDPFIELSRIAQFPYGGNARVDGYLQTYGNPMNPNPVSGLPGDGQKVPGEIAMVKALISGQALGPRMIGEALSNPNSIMPDVAHSAKLLDPGRYMTERLGWAPKPIDASSDWQPRYTPPAVLRGGSPDAEMGRFEAGFDNFPDLPYVPRIDMEHRRLFPGYAGGGSVWGTGTKTSDSIAAWLSNGEFVHNAAAVDYYGKDFMHAVNQRQIPKMAGGGDPNGGIAPPIFTASGKNTGNIIGGADGLPVDIQILGDVRLGSGADSTIQAPNNPFINPPRGERDDVLKFVQQYVAWQENAFKLTTTAPKELADALTAATDEYQKAGQKAADAKAALDAVVARRDALLALPGGEENLKSDPQLAADLATATREKEVADSQLRQRTKNAENAQTAIIQNQADLENLAAEGPPQYDAGKKNKKDSDKDAETLGAGLVKGIFEGLGFGDVFSDAITEWGIYKLAMGGLDYGINLAQSAGLLPGPDGEVPNGGLGAGAGPGVANGAIQTLLPGVTLPAAQLPGQGVPVVSTAASVTPAMAPSSAPVNSLAAGVGGPQPGGPGTVIYNTYPNNVTTDQMNRNIQTQVPNAAAAAPQLPANGGAGLPLGVG